MAFRNDWVNRTTKQYVANTSPRGMADNHSGVFVNGNGKPASNADWIYDPDLSAVIGQPTRYWAINGDLVALLSQAERDAMDATEQTVRRNAVVNQLDRVEDIMRAFALVVLDEINTLREQHGLAPRTITQLKTVLRVKLGT